MACGSQLLILGIMGNPVKGRLWGSGQLLPEGADTEPAKLLNVVTVRRTAANVPRDRPNSLGVCATFNLTWAPLAPSPLPPSDKVRSIMAEVSSQLKEVKTCAEAERDLDCPPYAAPGGKGGCRA